VKKNPENYGQVKVCKVAEGGKGGKPLPKVYVKVFRKNK